MSSSERSVLRVASEVASARDDDVPRILLRLRDLLEAPNLRAVELRKTKVEIWKCDLIHALVEALRQDFSRGRGGEWSVAVELASLLSNVCDGLRPAVRSKDSRHRGAAGGQVVEPKAEQIKEYYEILLPTAVDSLLILANNLLELESVDSEVPSHHGDEVPSLKYFEYFCSVVGSLIYLCTGHPQCVLRVMKSPYFLNALISDITDYCEVVVAELKRLVEIDPHTLSLLPEEILHSILDELAYKISGRNQNVAMLSVQTLSSFVKGDPSLLDVILTRYKGLFAVIRKWTGHELGPEVKDLIHHLEQRYDGQRQHDAASEAAVVIQSAWRGYSTRKRMKRAQRGIRRFQQLYRKRKASKLRAMQHQAETRKAQEFRQASLRDSLCSFHEKQLTTIQQLPASELELFEHHQRHRAATTLQAWWKAKAAQKEFSRKRETAAVVRNVVILQRAVRRFLGRRRMLHEIEACKNFIYPEIKGQERDALQLEIARHRELYPPTYKSEDQLRTLHEDVQGMLEEFYSSRYSVSQQDRQRTSLIDELNGDCDRLLSAPSLSAVTPDEVEVFSCDSAAIARMAQRAHEEELKAMQLPWWKRLQFDQEEVIL